MKKIMIFNMNSQWDENEYELASRGKDFSLAIDEYKNFLRNKLKYSEISDQEYEVYDMCNSKLFQILEDYGLLEVCAL